MSISVKSPLKARKGPHCSHFVPSTRPFLPFCFFGTLNFASLHKSSSPEEGRFNVGNLVRLPLEVLNRLKISQVLGVKTRPNLVGAKKLVLICDNNKQEGGGGGNLVGFFWGKP